MALTNDQKTARNFKLFYDQIKPYLNSSAVAGSTPVGTIIAVMGNSAPINYLICDGSEYNIADYLELANYFEQQFESCNYFGGDGVTKFAVPDLRGEFLRGAGPNSHENQGDGGDVGDHQDATLPDFEARMSFHGAATATVLAGIGGNAAQTIQQRSQYRPGGANTSGASSHDGISIKPSLASSVYVDGAEARPTNTSILYCIKAKSADATERSIQVSYEKYSTEEQVIGEWIDGKPLYQKTVILETPVAGWSQAWRNNVGFVAENIDFVVSAMPYSGTAGSGIGHEYIAINTETGYYNVYHESGFSVNHAGATFKYTKTTDTVNSFTPNLLTNYKLITQNLQPNLMNDIIVTKANINPSNYLVGNYVLIDKHLKDYLGLQDAEHVFFNAGSNTKSITMIEACISNNNLSLRFYIVTNVAIADSNVDLGTIDLSSIGIDVSTPNFPDVYIAGLSDGGNSILTGQWMVGGGESTIRFWDSIGTRTTNAGSDIRFNMNVPIPLEARMDEFCDLFYWKRVTDQELQQEEIENE